MAKKPLRFATLEERLRLNAEVPEEEVREAVKKAHGYVGTNDPDNPILKAIAFRESMKKASEEASGS